MKARRRPRWQAGRAARIAGHPLIGIKQRAGQKGRRAL